MSNPIVGAPVRAKATMNKVNDDGTVGALLTPATVVMTYAAVGGTVHTSTFPTDGVITNPSTGVYELIFYPDVPGTWFCIADGFDGGGTKIASDFGAIDVNKRPL